MNVYLSIPFAEENKRRPRAIREVFSELIDQDLRLLNEHVMNEPIIDTNFSDLSEEERSRAIAKDYYEKLSVTDILVAFVIPSYGIGAAEGYMMAKKMLVDPKVKILKLVHYKDIDETTSLIARNTYSGDLKVYRTAPQAVRFVREFLERSRTPEKNQKGIER